MKKRRTRRIFLKETAAMTLGTATLLTTAQGKELSWTSPGRIQHRAADPGDTGVRVIHSACLGCNARCGTRVVVKDEKIESISGNPYHPYNTLGQPVSYDTAVKQTIKKECPVCGKAKEAANYVYHPRRLLLPLKRAGKRGSGRFEPIEWDQLIREIVHGGNIFAHLGEKKRVMGLKDLDSDEPILPHAPELGPIRNQFVFMTGRLQQGRKAFIDRFVKGAMGSINRIGHTDICGLGFRMGNFIMTEGKQVELKADPWSCRYMLVFGANIYEALQPGINTYGATVAKRCSRGEMKFVVIDPRAQNASVHAHRWISIRPGRDGAFAMGIIRWMLENNAYNHDFLVAPNPGAAAGLGYPCYTNASHLVITQKDHADNGSFLRLRHLKVTGGNPDAFVVINQKGGHPVAFDQTDKAILNFEGRVKDGNGKFIYVKTAFAIMKEGVLKHSIRDYAEFSGTKKKEIETVAREFAAHGKHAAVCQYHGAGNYVSGTYAAFAVAALNCLAGSIGIKGGYLPAGGGIGTWKEGTYNLKRFPGRRKPKGVKISREKACYEKSSEYLRKKEKNGTGYPAARPWFPFTKGGLSVEALSGIDQSYPYPCKILFTYFYNPVYSTPGGYRFIETLKDTEKVPLFVSIDITVNESNLYADYIIPDITYMEGHYSWLTPHAPAMKFTAVRTPAIRPLTGRTPDGRHFSLETFLIDLARAADLPGFGEKAIPGEKDRLYPLISAEDFYIRGISNIAMASGIPPADNEEVAFVEGNYPAANHKQILAPQEWKKVCYLLARGGVFQHYEQGFEKERFAHTPTRFVLYNETLAQTVNPITGQRFHGSLRYAPPADSQGRKLDETSEEYPFRIVTYKMSIHTQSRTSWHSFAMEIAPENHVIIHPEDAKNLNVSNDSRVMLASRSNPSGISGKARLSRLIRKGTVAVSFHYGHSQSGASDLQVSHGEKAFLGGDSICSDGVITGNPFLGAGLNPNYVANLDSGLGNTPMVDIIGGIPDFSSTRVKIVKL